MRRLLTFMLLFLLSVAGSVPAHAQKRITPEENARQSQKAQKAQQKAMKKTSKQQRKAMKKQAKAQRKAEKRMRERSAP